MFRITSNITAKSLIPQAISNSVRYFSGTAITYAKAASKSKDGKKKVKQGFKKKADPSASKAKKGGMTHLGFRDAVSALKFEKLATDLSNLDIKNLEYKSMTDRSSKVVKYEDSVEEVLSVLGSFKKYQQHELFNRPVSMITENTLRLDAEFIQKLEKNSKDNRLCILGEKGVGKSTLISQIKALALSKYNGDVVLLHLDHPEKIVEGSSDYIYNKKIEKYQQPMFTKRWIKKLRTANEGIFKKLPLTRDASFVAKKVEYNLRKGENTLYDFVLYNHDFGKVGASDAFQFFIEELVHHSKDVPVLVSIDNFNIITSKFLTRYYHPDFTPIHVKDFEMGNLILELIGGDLNFQKGGVLLAESKDVAEALTLGVGLGHKEYDPYYKPYECDFKIAEKMLSNNGVQSFFVNNLTKDEANELLRFYEASGVLQLREYPSKELYKSAQQLSEEQVAKRSGEYSEEFIYNPEEQLEKVIESHYTVSSGNPGHLLRATTLLY